MPIRTPHRFFSPDPLKVGAILPPDHPVCANPAAKIERFGYRNFARARLGGLNAPQVRGVAAGGRIAVLYSPDGLAAGMVGQPVDGIQGYSPETATQDTRNIVLYAAKECRPRTS